MFILFIYYKGFLEKKEDILIDKFVINLFYSKFVINWEKFIWKLRKLPQ